MQHEHTHMSDNYENNDDNGDGFGLDLGYEIATIKKSSNVHPAGEFEFEIQRGKITLNKAEDIKTLELTLVNVETQKRVFARHPFASTRPTMAGMVAAGNDRIKELGEATGVAGSSIAPMIGQRVRAVVKVKEARGDYPESNEVSRYKPVTAPAASAATTATSSKAPAFMSRKG